MPDIRHEVLIGAKPETIYHAITNQEGLSAWWTPDVSASPEVGTTARFGFGPVYFKEMRIVELEAFKLIKWLCLKGADEWIGTAISFELASGNKNSLLKDHEELRGQIEQLNNTEGTLVVFHHNNWKEYTPMFAECNYTWAIFLRSLKLLCETGKGRPWPDQHRTGQ